MMDDMSRSQTYAIVCLMVVGILAFAFVMTRITYVLHVEDYGSCEIDEDCQDSCRDYLTQLEIKNNVEIDTFQIRCGSMWPYGGVCRCKYTLRAVEWEEWKNGT